MKKDHIIFDNTPGVPPGEFRFNGITRDVQTSVTSGTTNLQPTNADRIRAMSDKELAKWMRDWIDCTNDGYMCTGKRYKNSKRCDGHCIENRLDWLRQPAEECET